MENNKITIFIKRNFSNDFILESKEEVDGEKIIEKGCTLNNAKTYLRLLHEGKEFEFKKHWTFHLKSPLVLISIQTFISLLCLYTMCYCADLIFDTDSHNYIWNLDLAISLLIMFGIFSLVAEIEKLKEYIDNISDNFEIHIEDDTWQEEK